MLTNFLPEIKALSIPKDNGCINWGGICTTAGYPTIRVDGKKIYVHRILAAIYLGLDIESSIVVMHKCDNPSCVNTEHLQLGTLSDNMRDCAVKGRINNQNIDKTHCKYGHEFTINNTYTSHRKLATGLKSRRHCKVCLRQVSRKWSRKNKTS